MIRAFLRGFASTPAARCCFFDIDKEKPWVCVRFRCSFVIDKDPPRGVFGRGKIGGVTPFSISTKIFQSPISLYGGWEILKSGVIVNRCRIRVDNSLWDMVGGKCGHSPPWRWRFSREWIVTVEGGEKGTPMQRSCVGFFDTEKSHFRNRGVMWYEEEGRTCLPGKRIFLPEETKLNTGNPDLFKHRPPVGTVLKERKSNGNNDKCRASDEEEQSADSDDKREAEDHPE